MLPYPSMALNFSGRFYTAVFLPHSAFRLPAGAQAPMGRRPSSKNLRPASSAFDMPDALLALNAVLLPCTWGKNEILKSFLPGPWRPAFPPARQ